MSCKGLCETIYKAKSMFGGDRYANGQKLCRARCGGIFVQWSGLWCPCCSCKLRTKPRKNIPCIRCSTCNRVQIHIHYKKWFKLKGKPECVTCHFTRVGIVCTDCGREGKLIPKSRNYSFTKGKWYCISCYKRIKYPELVKNKITTAFIHLFKVGYLIG